MGDEPHVARGGPDPSSAALTVWRRLRRAGHEAYYAGGAVRDLVMGLCPQDYDIATSARPEEVTALFPRTVTVGAHFGVVVVIHEGHEIEVATFRAEGAYLDGRHPSQVTYSGAAEDVARRDFTINGLLYDPGSDQVIDLVGGQPDMAARLIRCIGDPEARFREDRLRLLRAVRFAVRFDFGIEEATWDALRRHAPGVLEVSAERIRDELLKMLTGPRPDDALRMLDGSGLLAAVLPEVSALHGVPQPPGYHPEGDVFEHTVRVMAHLGFDPKLPTWRREALAMAALLHDVGKVEAFDPGPPIRFPGHGRLGADKATEVARRLRMSRKQVDWIGALVAQHDRFIDARKMRRSRLLRFLRQPHFSDLLALHRADRLGASGDLTDYHFCRRALGESGEELHPPRLLDGHDLLAMGVPKGPQVGRWLARLEDAQMEGEVRTRPEAEAWILRRIRDSSEQT